MEKSVQTFVDEAAPNHVHSSTNNNNIKGGWISFPFIIGLLSSPLLFSYISSRVYKTSFGENSDSSSKNI